MLCQKIQKTVFLDSEKQRFWQIHHQLIEDGVFFADNDKNGTASFQQCRKRGGNMEKHMQNMSNILVVFLEIHLFVFRDLF